jgi:hypothetical protein
MKTFYRIVKIQQQGETSLTATIPNDIAEKIELFKRQYMKIYLEQIRNLPGNKREDGCDSFDLFTQSVKEISKNLSDSLKESDAFDPENPKDKEDTNPLKNMNLNGLQRLEEKFFEYSMQDLNRIRFI